MGDVIDIASRTTMMEGTGYCVGCHHSWPHRAPPGEGGFDCPACGAQTAVWRGICVPDPDTGLVWNCNCGNDMFFLTPTGPFCPGCGARQNGW